MQIRNMRKGLCPWRKSIIRHLGNTISDWFDAIFGNVKNKIFVKQAIEEVISKLKLATFVDIAVSGYTAAWFSESHFFESIHFHP